MPSSRIYDASTAAHVYLRKLEAERRRARCEWAATIAIGFVLFTLALLVR